MPKNADIRVQKTPAKIEMGQRIASLRERRGLTQAALADATRIRTPTISRYETGYTGVGLEAAVAIAEALSSTPEWIACGDAVLDPAFLEFMRVYAPTLRPALSPSEERSLMGLRFHRASPESYLTAVGLLRSGYSQEDAAASAVATDEAQLRADQLGVRRRR